MGVKRKVQVATSKVTSKFRQAGVGRRFSNPSSTGSLKARGIEFLYLLALFLLAAGVINAASNSGSAGINLETIVPNQGVQNATETFIMLFGYIVGSLGAYGLYLSGRQTIRARSSEMFFVGGIALVAIAMALGYYILSVK
ncbi:MAG: hypothetical protein ACREBS_04205 [Nitrososphaerales archaeon]